mgnify:CR=1 FL=1
MESALQPGDYGSTKLPKIDNFAGDGASKATITENAPGSMHFVIVPILITKVLLLSSCNSKKNIFWAKVSYSDSLIMSF